MPEKNYSALVAGETLSDDLAVARTNGAERSAPQLLVSVRNAAEAVAALRGGCDILDVKEPHRGPLGRADVAEMAAVAAVAGQDPGNPAVSVALGEIAEATDAAIGALPAKIRFAKLGAAGLAGDAAWIRTWQNLRHRVEGQTDAAVQWIAVAYADWRRAHSPPPGEIIAAAQETGCSGVLFDTFDKGSGGLLSWLSRDELRHWVAELRAGGQLAALAGQICRDDLPQLADVAADVIAVRSAACRAGSRTAEVDAQAVRQFKAALDDIVWAAPVAAK